MGCMQPKASSVTQNTIKIQAVNNYYNVDPAAKSVDQD